MTKAEERRNVEEIIMTIYAWSIEVKIATQPHPHSLVFGRNMQMFYKQMHKVRSFSHFEHPTWWNVKKKKEQSNNLPKTVNNFRGYISSLLQR